MQTGNQLKPTLRYERSSSFLSVKKYHSRILDQKHVCLLPRWTRKDAPTTFFRMFCASEVVCTFNILHEQYHSADRFVGNPSMFDIHVIICCALRVDSTCCCLALHTIWNCFTYFCVTRSPSLPQWNQMSCLLVLNVPSWHCWQVQTNTERP